MLNYYHLVRNEDVSGLSGIGVVAHVFELPNSAALLVWDEKNVSNVQSVVIYNNCEDLIKVHGHGGRTVLVQQDINEAADLTNIFDVVDKAHEYFMSISNELFELEHGIPEEDEV